MTIPSSYRVTVVVLLAMILAAALLAVMLAKPAWAEDTQCVGTLPPGVYDGNVVVPEGQFCLIEDSEVRGNVLVREGAILNMFASTVLGDVKGAEDVGIDAHQDNTVLGNVKILGDGQITLRQNTLRGTGPDGNPLGLRGDVKVGDDSHLNVFDSTVLGNVVGDNAVVVQVADSPFQPGASVVGKNIVHKGQPDIAVLLICGTTVEEGNIEVKKLQNANVNVGDDVFCGGSRGGGNTVLKGDITVSENTFSGPFAMLGVDQNTVSQGNVQVSKNVGEAPKTVQFNQVGGTLQCFANDPPFIGGPNIAREAEGQCF